MSGGIAYVYDKDNEFSKGLCNMEMVELETLDSQDTNELKSLIEKHQSYTGSTLASKLLGDWNDHVKHFVKVFPTDYKKALERIANEQKEAQLIS